MVQYGVAHVCMAWYGMELDRLAWHSMAQVGIKKNRKSMAWLHDGMKKEGEARLGMTRHRLA